MQFLQQNNTQWESVTLEEWLKYYFPEPIDPPGGKNLQRVENFMCELKNVFKKLPGFNENSFKTTASNLEENFSKIDLAMYTHINDVEMLCVAVPFLKKLKNVHIAIKEFNANDKRLNVCLLAPKERFKSLMQIYTRGALFIINTENLNSDDENNKVVSDFEIFKISPNAAPLCSDIFEGVNDEGEKMWIAVGAR
jgi:hypothetical protein